MVLCDYELIDATLGVHRCRRCCHERKSPLPSSRLYRECPAIHQAVERAGLLAGRIELAVCEGCSHYDCGPPMGCWLGLPHRTQHCLAGSQRLASMRLGRTAACARQLRARGQWPSRPRVGLLTPTLLFGGAERWVAALAAGLDPDRFDVVGVAIRDAGTAMPAIADRVRARCPLLEGESHFAALAGQCDTLIAWGLPNLSMFQEFVHRGGRVVVVSHGHCDWTVQCLQSCSPYTTDWAAVSRHAALSFPDPARVAVIHNGIDVYRCRPTRSRDEVRAAWDVGPDEILVGYVGRLSGEKRPLAAVEVVAALGPPFRATLVGGGPNVCFRQACMNPLEWLV